MKHLTLALAALSLAGCSVNLQPPAVAPVVQSTADKVILESTRALVLGHQAYQASAALLAPLLRAGVFNNAQIDRIAALKRQADALIAGADKTLTTAQRATALLGVVEQLFGLYSAAKGPANA